MQTTEIIALNYESDSQGILATLENAGIKWVAVKDSVAEYKTYAGTPRGWPAGMSYSNVPGTFDVSTMAVIIATSGKNGHGSYDLVLHETGHAYDYVMGYASQSALFQQQYNRTSGLSPYYTQTGNPSGYLSEAYAESFANFYGGNYSYKNKYPNIWAYWSGAF